MRVRLLMAAALLSAAAVCSTPAFVTSAPVTTLAGCGTGYYQNSDGQCIPRPSPGQGGDGGAPTGATAQCRDGNYSFSTHHSGTCSGHGGVKQWIGN